MRIVVDVMGGDRGPDVVVDGARLALTEYSSISELFLVGNETDIRAAMQKTGLSDSRVQIVHASQVLTMEDKPVDGLRKKKDCSLMRAVELVKDGRGQAIISTGNTGGIVAASTIRLRTLEGVERPAIAPVMPSGNGYFVLLDAGATPECKPIHLAQFAIMGSLYCSEVLGTKNPRVGILSNGSEEMKGTELTREAHKLCRNLGLNYIGYVEGHDLFNDAVEVVVTDGFLGNIVLKSCESLGRAVGKFLKRELNASPVRRLGKVLAGNALLALKTKLDPDIYGGAPLLGLNGTVIKAHGSANARAIKNAIRVATETIQHQLNASIVKEISKTNELVTAATATT
ncbi:MAG TPA: phosphate acyltransferase PlsX [Verrucomicrobiae bacterium]